MGADLKIRWLEQPEEHDYPAAHAYLSLVLPVSRVSLFVMDLKRAEVGSFAAKDIFRSSRLALLDVSNSHVAKDLRKIKKGERLSPLLLVRHEGRTIIADGYHRLCAVYSLDEDARIPCKIV
jgi:hypothetical protein